MRFIDDGFASEDLIGYDAAKRSVVQLINSIEVSEGAGSFTIGVFGDWGTGKTSILKQIQSEIEDDEDGGYTIWFNPWQYSKSTDIVHAFLEAVLTECLNGEKSNLPATKKAAMHARDFGANFLRTSQGLLNKTQLSYNPDGSVSFGVAPPETSLKPDRGIFEHYNTGDLLSRIQSSARCLKDTKLVVFIDDVDRCSPDASLDLLDGIKVLFDIPNFIFIIGASKRIIEKAVRHRYNNFYDTESVHLSDMKVDYLDKLIQFEFTLPRPDRDKIVENVIKPFLSVTGVSEDYASIIADSVPDYNPRTIKRLFNVIQFSIITGKNKMGDSLDSRLALKAAVLKDRHKLIANFLTEYPNDLLRIQGGLIDEAIAESGSHINALTMKLRKSRADELESILDPPQAPVIMDILKPKGDGAVFLDVTMIRNYLSLAELSTSQSNSSSPEDANTILQDLPSDDTLLPSETAKGFDANFVKFSGGTLTQTDNSSSRNVELSYEFALGKYEVTRAEYFDVLGKANSREHGDSPVSGVSWWDAAAFCNKLSELANLNNVYDLSTSNPTSDLKQNGYRLPTEAEWEFALRSSYDFTQECDLMSRAWHSNNSKYEIHDVGLLVPFGELYDMLGNVWEWCDDWYGPYNNAQPNGPESGVHKVCKGGSYTNFSNILSPEYRGKEMPSAVKPNVGFRLARTITLSGDTND